MDEYSADIDRDQPMDPKHLSLRNSNACSILGSVMNLQLDIFEQNGPKRRVSAECWLTSLVHHQERRKNYQYYTHEKNFFTDDSIPSFPMVFEEPFPTVKG